MFSTLVGGTGQDSLNVLTLDSAGNIWVGGATNSTNTAGNLATRDTDIQINPRGGYDAFVQEIDPTGKKLLYGSYLAGTGNDTVNALALDGAGNVYAGGQTCSLDFPVTAGTLQTAAPGTCSAFVSKMHMATPTPPRALPSISRFLNYVLGTPTYSPGSIIAVEGSNLASTTAAFATPGEKSGKLPLSLGGTTVNVCLAGLFSVSPSRILGQIPYDVGPQCTLQVTTSEGQGQRTAQPTMQVGVGILRVYKSDMTVSSPSNRIQPGDTVIVHVTGVIADPKAPSGVPIPDTPVYQVYDQIPPPQVIQPASPQDGPADCKIVSQRLAPGYVGVAEIRVQIPGTASSDSGEWDFYFGFAPNNSNKVRIYPVVVKH